MQRHDDLARALLASQNRIEATLDHAIGLGGLPHASPMKATSRTSCTSGLDPSEASRRDPRCNDATPLLNPLTKSKHTVNVEAFLTDACNMSGDMSDVVTVQGTMANVSPVDSDPAAYWRRKIRKQHRKHRHTARMG